MKKQSSIELNDFTNFLSSGAFARWKGFWYLFWNPTETRNILASDMEMLEGVYNTQFISGQLSVLKFANKACLTTQKIREILNTAKLYLNTKVPSYETYFEPEWDIIEKDLFRKSFENIKEAMSLGKTQKAVPICFQYGKIPFQNQLSLLQKLDFMMALTESVENLIPYGQWAGDSGFVGLTPEVFFSVFENNLHTMALAGTSSKEVPVIEFLNDNKERNEHEIVIQDLKEKLNYFGDLRVGKTQVFELPHLNHLKTDMSVTLKDNFNPFELIHTMHPTSALGIYPKNSYWQEFIELPYQQERKSFGAPWGFKFEDQTLFVVGIRRLEWNTNRVRIGAGCGIVQQSEFEKEFAEIERKMNSVKKVFVSANKFRENLVHE